MIVLHAGILDAQLRFWGEQSGGAEAAGTRSSIRSTHTSQRSRGRSKAQTPELLALDATGAHEFLTEKAAALEQAGFGVMLPAWWTRKGTKLRLTARANVQSPKMQGGSGMSLDNIVQFDWQVALGDEKLTFEELQTPAKLKEPLVNVRGHQALRTIPCELFATLSPQSFTDARLPGCSRGRPAYNRSRRGRHGNRDSTTQGAQTRNGSRHRGGRHVGLGTIQDGDIMKLYHVAVHREDQWYIGRVLERSGVTTQGRTLDELVSMLRDAIEALWSEEDVRLELVLAPDAVTVARSRTGRRRASA